MRQSVATLRWHPARRKRPHDIGRKAPHSSRVGMVRLYLPKSYGSAAKLTARRRTSSIFGARLSIRSGCTVGWLMHARMTRSVRLLLSSCTCDPPILRATHFFTLRQAHSPTRMRYFSEREAMGISSQSRYRCRQEPVKTPKR